MNKYLIFAFCGCLFCTDFFSQTKNMEKILNQIEQNNLELRGYKSFIEGQQLENKSANNLPDPQLSAYYLPYGNNETGDYSEYEISQSFEFPTVYFFRNQWNDSKSIQLQASYAKKRKEILLKAKKMLIEFTFLQRQKTIETDRRTRNEKVFEQMQELYDDGQVSILDLKKSKITRIQEQFVVDQIESDIQIILSKLKTINGGISINGFTPDIDLMTEVAAKEKLWQEKLVKDPRLQELKAAETVSLQKIKLEKNKVLPDVALGYNYQGFSSSNNSGFYGGLTIPLWSRRNKVKAAEADYEYKQSTTQVAISSLQAEFKETYERYNLMTEKYEEYQTTMSDLSDEKLLFNAYKSGKYSLMDYYAELQFYREASDKLLQMEKEIQLLKAELLEHQL